MKRSIRTILAGIAACTLLAQGALAETITFNGTVTAARTVEIYAPIGGTVEAVPVTAGQQVKAGDVLASLSTEKVYATEAGTVTGVFGNPGDSAETIANRYGAVMYIEGESVYTISASTEDAYNATANKFVHVGEQVLLRCYSDGDHSGAGVITAIEGTNFTVEVTSGEFLMGEKVNVFRDEIASSQRIGRGDLSRKNPTAVSAQGSIVSIAVQNGDTVKKGDLLLETLSGSFDGLYMCGSDITASEGGVIYQINAQQGGKLEKDSVAAVLYPEGAMRIEGQVSEANLAYIHVGDPVSIELLWNQDEEVQYEGTVTMISAIATEAAGMEGEDVTYTVYVDFTPDANTKYGMSAIITTLEAEDLPEEAEADA